MPGILPMKVIKVGSNAQSRIAQACDRCRSKKIRCDGVRPCCSQCSNVGFECKTSDKLSRRAFPRGYTESLEERVRLLELEVRELKELLDEKDEKIDMLSRIHSQSSHPIQLPSVRRPSTVSVDAKAETPPKDDVFKVQQSPYLTENDGTDSYFAGTSSGRTFIEAFKTRIQESGRSAKEIDITLLLSSSARKATDTSDTASAPVFKAPARMESDQLINIFFQEWAPLFPVLHRPTFLTLYGRYVADCDSVTDKAEIAQLNLVFGIAALSNGARSTADVESFEAQWKAALDSIISDYSMATLQALILAQIFCVQAGDLTRLLSYKGLSSSLSARLGLHQSQKRFALGTLTCETRKKVFWTLYAVDCFTAVVLGLPKHLKDDDINCEYPVDADDEYVTERGFQPTLPGESTKLSSALALFRACRILTKVLEQVYPAKTSYELSLRHLGELSEELDTWSSSLPAHLRLNFAQDKPSTGTINSRSPLLSLMYHYIRALIHRPAVCASIGARSSSSSMISLASSCKHMIQIIQLLDERGLSFTCCLNRDEVLVLAGVGLLFQNISLDPKSKILKDNSKMLNSAVQVLKKTRAPCAMEFERVVDSLKSTQPQKPIKLPTLSRHNSDGGSSLQTSSLPASTKQQLKAIASRFASSASAPASSGHLKPPIADGSRRATLPTIGLYPNMSPPSQLGYTPAATSRSEPARSPVDMYNNNTSSRPASTTTLSPALPPPPPRKRPNAPVPNLDYLSFGNDDNQKDEKIKPEPGPTDWEKLLGNLDNGETNIYDACYGGSVPVDIVETSQVSEGGGYVDQLWALCQTETNTSGSLGGLEVSGSTATDESGGDVEGSDWSGERFVVIAQGDDFWG